VIECGESYHSSEIHICDGKPIGLNLDRPASDMEHVSDRVEETVFTPEELAKRTPYDVARAREYLLKLDKWLGAGIGDDLRAANKGAETNANVNQLMAADLLRARTALEELVEAVKAEALGQDALVQIERFIDSPGSGTLQEPVQQLLTYYYVSQTALAQASAALKQEGLVR
jgi:hypothetical protein